MQKNCSTHNLQVPKQPSSYGTDMFYSNVRTACRLRSAVLKKNRSHKGLVLIKKCIYFFRVKGLEQPSQVEKKPVCADQLCSDIQCSSI